MLEIIYIFFNMDILMPSKLEPSSMLMNKVQYISNQLTLQHFFQFSIKLCNNHHQGHI
jgi:hypothetical protein